METMTLDADVQQLIGANRGGKAYEEQSFGLMPRQIDPAAMPKLVIYDQKGERAKKLAQEYRTGGIEAEGVEGTAEEALESPARVRTFAIDSPNSILYGLEKGDQALLQVGFVVTPNFPPRGGRLVGVIITMTKDDWRNSANVHDEAKTFMGCLAELSPNRVTSREMTAPPVQEIQIDPLRKVVHREIARSNWDFLQDRPVESGMYAVQTLGSSGQVFPMRMAPASMEAPAVLRHWAVDIAAAQNRTDRLAVGFHSSSRPWLYLTFLVYNMRWQVPYTVELPVSEKTVRVYENAWEANHPQPRVFITD